MVQTVELLISLVNVCDMESITAALSTERFFRVDITSSEVVTTMLRVVVYVFVCIM